MNSHPQKSSFCDLGTGFLIIEHELCLKPSKTIISKLIKILEKESGEISSLDGIRIDKNSCWGLVRASNTSPNLVLRFEGNSPKDLDDIKNVFKKAISKVDNTIKINF